MKTKYDWSNVPKEVKWIATDKDSWAFGWTEKPISGGIGWNSPSGLGFCDYFSLSPIENKLDCYWQDSLEERPHDL